MPIIRPGRRKRAVIEKPGWGNLMRTDFRRLSACLLFVLLLTIQGCGASTPAALMPSQNRPVYKGSHQVDPFMKEHIPRTVAVLPFVGFSGKEKSAHALRCGFYNHFSSLPFEDMTPAKVDERLAGAGLTAPAAVGKKTPQELGKILGVDAVVFGFVSHDDKKKSGLSPRSVVAAEVKMYDARTGNLLWSGKHKVAVHQDGGPARAEGIVAAKALVALSAADIQLLHAIDDLFGNMVKTIPLPPVTRSMVPVRISLFTQDTRGLPKKAGEEINVVMQGEPQMRAYFDLGEHKQGMAMEEVEPGGYCGVYQVRPGDRLDRAMATGYLQDAAGNTGQWTDATSWVTVDTSAPDKPEGIRATGGNKQVGLQWDEAPASDLAAYHVYRSESPRAGYALIGKTLLPRFVDADNDLVNFKTYYYRVAVVDFAGNEGEAAQIHGVPVPPGPTVVSGPIEADTVWYAGAGPYVLTGDVMVGGKAHLIIEPGTEIQSRGGGLTIEGRLTARGEHDAVISFEAQSDVKVWPGITFTGVFDRENKMAFVRVKNASIGVHCLSSSPLIEKSEFLQNGEALRISGEGSKPLISRNAIYKNRGAGISIHDGASPRVLQNSIHDNGGAGLAVQSASPEVVQNTITRNHHDGLDIKGAQPVILQNNIADNAPYNVSGAMSGPSVKVLENWWGGAKPLEAAAGFYGRIDFRSLLDAPWPQGKTQTLSVLDKNLGGPIKTDAYLLMSASPYRVTKDVVVDGGATLYIGPGVVVEFERKTTIIAQNGGIVARGTKDRPITFTAASASPAPGFYTSVAQFIEPARVKSSFAYCIVKYAVTAFDIYEGSPEIISSYIAHSSQGGVYCRKEATPVISHSTFFNNAGEGAIVCFGRANPKIFQNNFIGNAWAIQSVSSGNIDARNNWWGVSPPDAKTIWGENVIVSPWLKKENPEAFRESR